LDMVSIRAWWGGWCLIDKQITSQVHKRYVPPYTWLSAASEVGQTWC
jgi:hypothetical protein